MISSQIFVLAFIFCVTALCNVQALPIKMNRRGILQFRGFSKKKSLLNMRDMFTREIQKSMLLVNETLQVGPMGSKCAHLDTDCLFRQKLRKRLREVHDKSKLLALKE